MAPIVMQSIKTLISYGVKVLNPPPIHRIVNQHKELEMYVYFIQAFRDKKHKIFKIGKANDPKRRVKELQTGSPVKLKLLGTIKCKSEWHSEQLEKRIHDLFYKQRRRGEWFTLGAKDVSRIHELIADESAKVEFESGKASPLSLYNQANRILGLPPSRLKSCAGKYT
jgi:hypothetical protein